MTGSVALDVVIGLVFIYSLYSLLTTTITEMISTLFRLRSSFLQRGITRMLDDGSGKRIFSDAFYKQPLIKYLGSGNLFGWIKQPSYLSAQNFSKAVLEVLKDVGKAGTTDSSAPARIKAALNDATSTISVSETVKFIRSLLEDSQNDIEKLKTLIEQWYDDTMERVASWYKKWIQLVTLIVGFAIAIIFNVDTVAIVKTLSTDDKAREQYVTLAKELVNDKEVQEKIEAIKSGSKDSVTYDKVVRDYEKLSKMAFSSQNVLAVPRQPHWNKHLAGWLLTALALSLGAPFWFDLLNKLVKLRGSIQPASQPQQATGPSEKGTLPTKKVG